jgi:hypothetical protein
VTSAKTVETFSKTKGANLSSWDWTRFVAWSTCSGRTDCGGWTEVKAEAPTTLVKKTTPSVEEREFLAPEVAVPIEEFTAEAA